MGVGRLRLASWEQESGWEREFAAREFAAQEFVAELVGEFPNRLMDL